MEQQSPFLAIITNDSDRQSYNQLAIWLGYSYANVIVGTPSEAASALAQLHYYPKYVVIDIDERGGDVLPELMHLSEHCDPSAHVVVVGSKNDIHLYRALMDIGVLEYFTKPVDIEAIRSVLLKVSVQTSADKGKIISFIGAASGDGSSTIAVNTAYGVATATKKSTVLVDLDYQFGMIAKNLDMSNPHSIKEIFDYPERGIDATLVSRLVMPYKDGLDIVCTPNGLHYLPAIPPELIRSLLQALQERYDYVLLDLPHLWTSWVSSALTTSNQIVLTAQLWLKSITHYNRLYSSLKQLGVSSEDITLVINRSGAKFKEGVNPRDFERISAQPINHFIANDIKTVIKAENRSSTILELGNSALTGQINQIVERLTSELSKQDTKSSFKKAGGQTVPGLHSAIKRIK